MMKTGIQKAIFPLAILMSMAVMLAVILPRLVAAQQDQPNQQDQQTQQNQDQSQTDQKAKKKKGGIFSGTNDVNTQSSDQKKLTASAGTKGALDGKQIADKMPTEADRQQVADMEKYSVPQDDLKKFQEDGHLQPK